jgi:hypothetical protein
LSTPDACERHDLKDCLLSPLAFRRRFVYFGYIDYFLFVRIKVMPSGGARPGGGRPVGSKDGYQRRHFAVALEELRDRAVEVLKTNDAAIFEGDSLEFVTSIYRNEELPIGLRVHAASLALPFERPRLSATALITRELGASSDPSFGKLFAEFEQRLALHPPEKRVELIAALREPEDEPSKDY